MKRFALILLLLVVPVEASWAAVAAWCQHEQGQAANHFGHHDHKHQGTDDGSDDPGKPHNDCGFCHFASAQSLSSHPVQIHIYQATAVFDFKPVHYTSHIPDALDRPNRRFVA
ncbi:MAG: cobalt-zinc-cadmium resistance protein [Burkholderiales bacterium]|nr:cobalt-zinc-cadmium resistance protein [Burkholderiales bacterium]